MTNTKIFIIILFIYFSFINIYFIIPIFFIGSKKKIKKNHFYIIVFLLFILFSNKILFDNIDEGSIIKDEMFEVYEVKDNNYFINKGNTNYSLRKNDEKFVPGDIILINGVLKNADSPRTDIDFNYDYYLKSYKISYILEAKSVKYIKNIFNINIIGHRLKENIDKQFDRKSANYIKTLVFGNSLEGDISDDIRTLGINHLFAISGLHITLIISYLVKIMSLLKIKSKFFLSIFLIFYILITNYSISVTRAGLMFIISNEFNKKKLFSSLDICLLVMIIQLIINPYSFYNIGFIYSYFIAFIIILSKQIIVEDEKFKATFKIAVYIFLIVLPINIYYNYEVSVLSVFFNIIFSFIVVVILLPSTIIIYFFPLLENYYLIIIDIFERIVKTVTNFEISIVVGRINLIFLLLIYYIVVQLLCILETKTFKPKRIICVLFCMFIFSLDKIEKKIEISFLNIQSAESTIIIANNCVTIFDVGEGYNTNNVDNYIIPHLKSRGINRIDNVFITHDHYDHYGGILNLQEKFDIDNIYINEYSKLIYQKIRKKDKISCGNIVFKILGPVYNRNVNDNSLVIYFEIEGYRFLFTGDIERSAENDILNMYHELNVDFLKVAHHGSDTSSTQEFLEHIKPKVGFVPVDKNNVHEHPDINVINRLNKMGVTTYRTDLDNSIYLYIDEGKYYINKN